MKISGVDRLVLDTSAYSRMRAGNTAVLDLVAGAGTVYLPVIVLGELEAGFKLGNRTRENLEALEEFLAEPFVATQSVTRTVTRRYGELVAKLRQAGTPIPTNDIWIAAITMDCGGHLVTFDSDFKSVTGLSYTLLVP